MRKELIDELKKYIEDLNKDVFGLDLEYLTITYSLDARSIRNSESKFINKELHYFWNEFHRQYNEKSILPNSYEDGQRGRFVVSIDSIDDRGSGYKLIIDDRKRRFYVTSKKMYWYVLRTRTGEKSYSTEALEWIFYVLCRIYRL